MTFDIIIAAAPTPDGSLQKDIELLKPALIYGDRIRLFSPTATLLQAMAGFANAKGEDRIVLYRQAFEAWGRDQLHQVEVIERVYLRLFALGENRNKAEQEAFEAVEAEFDAMFAKIRGSLDQLLLSASMPDLETAVASGLVDIEPLLDQTEADIESVGELVDVFIERLHKELDTASGFPLFDDVTGNIINLQVQEGLLTPSAVATERGKHVGVAAGILSSLPTFPAASMSEILDIRSALEQPLVRFRAAVAKLASDISASPFSPDFGPEVHDVYIREVAPALVEITEAIQENNALRQLTRAAARDTGAQIIGALSLGVATAGVVPELAALGVTGAAVGARAAWERVETRRKIERHQFYLLHRAQELLP